jgi:SAM-dependent methyltransferase
MKLMARTDRDCSAQSEASMYVCPNCKTPLEHFYCKECRCEYSRVDGIPVLLSKDRRFQDALKIAAAYDSIYEHHRNPWENQGKPPQFFEYFSSLLSRFQYRRFLEIGCGEGHLLASLNAGEKFAVDLSAQAIKVARSKTQAHVSIALAERLPFPAEYFDLIASVGTMEHFLDINDATREITRVLKPGGHYVALTHVDLSFLERLGVKVSEYVFPRPRPVRFARWLRSRLNFSTRPAFIKQPIQNRYSRRGAKALIEHNALKVIDVIHTGRFPQIPLMGPWVVIYIAQK